FVVFDEVFLSFELGLIKPEKEIYNSVVRKLKVSPQEIFYTDDRGDLVESAKALGLRGSVFTSFEQLVKDIQDAGIVFIDDENKKLQLPF
ncbi:MAG: HAD-IA family hydrolase, partial [Candidatus Omnitrophota bacterium]|nr:HAD-IA family hydrolase [Candidatus Omnitrophota bacterium]